MNYKVTPMKQCALTLLIVLNVCVLSHTGFSAENLANRQLLELIDLPTAGTLPHRGAGLDLRLYSSGGVLAGGALGFLDRLNTAVYFGGENLIGEGGVNWNPQIGVDIRLRVLNESNILPAIAAGFTTQGWGGYNEEYDRYAIKAKGFYLVASRNYWLLGNLGFHGGINKSLENDDEDDDVNVFAGLDKGLPYGVEILLEYDFAFNDNETSVFGKGDGYLNAGIRWAITSNYYFEIDFKNLTRNRPDATEISREIKFGFMTIF